MPRAAIGYIGTEQGLEHRLRIRDALAPGRIDLAYRPTSTRRLLDRGNCICQRMIKPACGLATKQCNEVAARLLADRARGMSDRAALLAATNARATVAIGA